MAQLRQSQDIDVAAPAREAASLFGQSDELETDACELIWETDQSIGDDTATRARFRAELTKAGVLPRRDGALGPVSETKYCMVCIVGEHSNIFRNPAVRRALGGGGYSKKYQAAKLYKALKGSQRDRITALVRHLDRGDITRDTIAAITKRAKQAAAGNDILGRAAKNGGYCLLTCLPNAYDLKLISATYPNADTLRCALGVYDDLAEAAAAVVFAPVRHLPSIIEKLLPACGFNSAKYVFLLRRPDSPSLLASEVAVIGERGDVRNIKPASVDWLPNGDEIDRLTYVDRLAPGSQGKLLMFSSERRAGWHNRTWAEVPSL